MSQRESDHTGESISAQTLAYLELDSGHFRKALDYSESAVSITTEAKGETGNALGFRARAHFVRGDITASSADFQRVTELRAEGLITSILGIWEAEGKLLRGDRTGALSQTQANREFAVRKDYNDTLCRSNALLARLLVPDDPTQAAQHLQDARAFANRSGQVDLQLGCFHAACEIHRHLEDYPQAIAEAEAGILLADTCGFGQFSIDLRLALAETYLLAGDPRKALQNARNALDRSEHPTANTPGAEPTDSTSADSPTSNSANASSPDSVSPPPSISANASDTDASKKPAAPSIYAISSEATSRYGGKIKVVNVIH